MNRLAEINLIHLFDFYLAAMFLFSLLRRFELYGTAVGIVVASPGRWPRLLRVMKEHRALFLTWTTFRPLTLALGLWAIQMIASRLIWPRADLNFFHVLDSWFIPLLLGLTFVPMIAVDAYFLIRVGRIECCLPQIAHVFLHQDGFGLLKTERTLFECRM